jgi:dinuclear metal center YbgI/SA1388 family protein
LFAKGQTVIQWFEQFSPKYLAMPDDKIGLQLGTLQKEIRKVLITLDVTDAVVEEAIQEQVDLIIAHHAIIYRPLPHLQTDTPAGRLYERLIKHDIAVYIAHTNLDVAEGGVNDMMAEALGLLDLSCLEAVYTEKLKKLVCYVPQTHHQQVLDALFAAGVGSIGPYSSCSFSFSSPGTGTFLPQEGTNPFIGEPGRLERVQEVRVETIVPESLQRKAVQAMLKAHPYEEAAYDLYPLEQAGRVHGLGRVGKLPAAVTLRELAELAKTVFDVPAVRVVGDLERPIRKVAVLGGSGGRYVRHAIFAGADVLVTGDIDYHTAHDAAAAGLALLDVGHNVEKILKRGVATYLAAKLAKTATQVVASQVDTEPFKFL